MATLDWDTLKVPDPAHPDNEPAERRPECIFETCNTTHTARTAFSCHDCGGTTVRTCMREHIPAHIVPEWLEGAGDRGWVCPECAWVRQAVDEETAADLAAGAGELGEDGEYSEADSQSGTGLQHRDAHHPADSNTDLRVANSLEYLLKLTGRLEKEQKELKKTVETQAKQIATLQKALQRTEAELPADFSAHIVSTWGSSIATAPGRRLVKAEVSRVFRQAELSDAPSSPDWQHQLIQAFDSLFQTMGLIRDDDDPDRFIEALHKTIVAMNSHFLLKGRAGARLYLAKAKIMDPAKYDAVAHGRLLREGRATQDDTQERRAAFQERFLQERNTQDRPAPYSGKGHHKGRGGKGKRQ